MIVPIEAIDHINVRCSADKLAQVRAFYQDVLGLEDGDRPPFAFDGAWMYLGKQAVIHIAVYAPKDTPRSGEISEGVDHFAFRARDRQRVRAHLADLGVVFEERHVPNRNLVQIFLRDPVGTRIELGFVGDALG